MWDLPWPHGRFLDNQNFKNCASKILRKKNYNTKFPESLVLLTLYITFLFYFQNLENKTSTFCSMLISNFNDIEKSKPILLCYRQKNFSGRKFSEIKSLISALKSPEQNVLEIRSLWKKSPWKSSPTILGLYFLELLYISASVNYCYEKRFANFHSLQP